MEYIAFRLQREWESHDSTRKLPSNLLVVFCIWIGIATVSITAVTICRSAPPPPSPFASFADVFPGQPRSAVEARRFSCVTGSYNGSEGAPNEHCTLNSATGVFSQVSVGIYKDVVQSIYFTSHDNTIRVGDLMLLWGQGNVREIGRTTYLDWRDNGVTAAVINDTEWFSLYLSVETVYFQPVPPSTS